MWQQFTERSRRVVFFAQEEAGKLGENYVSTEHLLLGLVRENDSVAARILDRMGVSTTAVQQELMRYVARGDGRAGQDMQLTPRAKRVIDLSYDEAQQLNSNFIGTEHLLLGLIREAEGLAGKTLLKLGVDLERARLVVQGIQDADPPRDSDGKIVERVRVRVDRLRERLGFPPSEESLPHFLPGDLGIVKATEGRTHIEVAINEPSHEALRQTFQAKDAHGYRELEMTSRFFLLPAGTTLKRLVPPAAGENKRDIPGMYVRILSGDHEGEAGWISPESFERTGPDESPFPPI